MKRRNFIISAFVVGTGLPVAYYLEKHNGSNNVLNKPDLLGRFCNEMELKSIGVKYRAIVPLENEKQKLRDLLLSDRSGQKIKSSDKILVAELIDKKTKEDFVSYNTIIINGWVISITEARQCALFSLT
jgi:hypothetical protein